MSLLSPDVYFMGIGDHILIRKLFIMLICRVGLPVLYRIPSSKFKVHSLMCFLRLLFLELVSRYPVARGEILFIVVNRVIDILIRHQLDSEIQIDS